MRYQTCAVLWFAVVLSVFGFVRSLAPRPHSTSATFCCPRQQQSSATSSTRCRLRPLPTRKTSTCLHVTPKENLLSFLSELTDNPDRLPCGLECTEKEHSQIAQLIAATEADEVNNLVLSRRGKIEAKDVLGEWKLLYTSSRTMAINKSLSGLGRSSSELAIFAGLRQKLTGSKYVSIECNAVLLFSL